LDLSDCVKTIKKYKGVKKNRLSNIYIKDLISYFRINYIPSSNHNYDNVLNILLEKMFEFKIDKLPHIMIYLITKSVFLGQLNNLMQLY